MNALAKHLVLVGGGHAHMTVMMNVRKYVQRGHHVTLVSSSPFHYYSGMGPGMLSGIYRPEEIRFHVKKLVEDRGASFLQGHVVRLDPERRILVLESGKEVPYDVVSFNTGSDVPLDTVSGVTEDMVPVKPIVKLLEARQRILKQVERGIPRIVVIGGGAAGLEVACGIWRLVHDHKGSVDIRLLAGRNFLAPYPPKVRRLALKSLASRYIEVIEGARVDRLESGLAVLEDAKTYPFDLIFLAVGVRPSPIFRNSGIPVGQDGGLLVNSYLQSVAHPNIFGGGDCISLQDHPLDKVGVHAVRQNPVLDHNLMAALEGNAMESFVPQDDYLLIFNLGNGKGIFRRKAWVWHGRLAFHLKDYIDRRFMRTFQVSGERAS